MVRKIFFFLSAYVLLYTSVNAQQINRLPQKATKNKIIERSGDFAPICNEFTITPDSLAVRFVEYYENGNNVSHYARAIDEKTFDSLLLPFHRLYLSQLKSNYEGPSLIDHDWNYDIVLSKGESIKGIRIFKYKLAPLFSLCKRMNLLLPAKFNISYTQEYFEN
jgi:hypothetical protein